MDPTRRAYAQPQHAGVAATANSAAAGPALSWLQGKHCWAAVSNRDGWWAVAAGVQRVRRARHCSWSCCWCSCHCSIVVAAAHALLGKGLVVRLVSCSSGRTRQCSWSGVCFSVVYMCSGSWFGRMWAAPVSYCWAGFPLCKHSCGLFWSVRSTVCMFVTKWCLSSCRFGLGCLGSYYDPVWVCVWHC